MKKKLLLIFSICLAIVAFVIIGGTISGDHLTTKKTPENEKIYIGVFESLSGVNAAGGNQELLGLEYVRSQRPTVYVGGIPYDIEFVIKDNASEAMAAEKAAQQLASSGISAVLGSYGSAVSIIGGEIFKDAGIPAIGISCTNPGVTAENSLYFRICFTDDLQGKVLAKYVYGSGLRNIAVITQAGDTYSKGLGQYFTDEFESLGGEVIDFSFNSVQTNFEDLAHEIMKSGSDGVFMPSPAYSGAIFIKQSRRAGMSLPIFGSDTWDTEIIISETGSYGKNVFFSSAFDADASSQSNSAGFAAKFSSWVSEDEDRIEQNGGSSYAAPVAALAYDAYNALADAIENADSFESAAIAENLAGYSFTGVTGDISFDGSGNAGKKDVFIKTIDAMAKKFELLQTVAAAQ